MKRQQTLRQINALYTTASDLAVKLVEQEARNILRRRPKLLTKFVMGMGTWCFVGVEKNGQPAPQYDGEDVFTALVADIIGEWDPYLKITGQAMMFTADGPNEFEDRSSE